MTDLVLFCIPRPPTVPLSLLLFPSRALVGEEGQ